MGDIEDLGSLPKGGNPYPGMRDGDKLLIAMSRNKASDMQVFCGKRLGFKVAGKWHYVGNRDLREMDIRGCLDGILTADQLDQVLAGDDIQLSYGIPGHGEFFLRVFLRDGTPAISAVNA